MKVARKLLVTGGTTLVLAGGMLAFPPLSPSAGATSLEAMTKPVSGYVLKDEAATDFDIQTEVDPGTHTLWATVTNKTDKVVVPQVTFNGESPALQTPLPIAPGKSMKYAYYFSGNNFTINVMVAAAETETATSTATVNIQEPVTFKATETNKNVVIGSLTNNSTLVPQTVYTKSYTNEMKVEYLEPGETRTIAIPQTTVDGQLSSSVTIATGAGYESTYTVPVDLKPVLPPIPLS